MCREVRRGESTDVGKPHPHPSTPKKQRHGRGRGWGGTEGGGADGGGEGAQGEQKIQAQVGGNPVQSKANQNFKPYLRCLTSGEPDLGKGKERKKKKGKTKKEKKKKERKGERNKENTSHQNQPERGEKKSCCCHNLKALFNL